MISLFYLILLSLWCIFPLSYSPLFPLHNHFSSMKNWKNFERKDKRHLSLTGQTERNLFSKEKKSFSFAFNCYPKYSFCEFSKYYLIDCPATYSWRASSWLIRTLLVIIEMSADTRCRPWSRFSIQHLQLGAADDSLLTRAAQWSMADS